MRIHVGLRFSHIVFSLHPPTARHGPPPEMRCLSLMGNRFRHIGGGIEHRERLAF